MSTSPQITIPPGFATLASEIPKLCSTNWGEFKDAMEMLFMGCGADYIIDATASTTIPKDCVRLDKQLTFYIWTRVDDEFRYLVNGTKSSALLTWMTLLSHFQKSTMPRRVAAREQLYSVVHDPSKSIDIFIHSVTSAAKVLADLGHKIEDTEIKDILLMRLDDSYATVRTSIMTSKEEPDLATIKDLLSSASDSIPQPTVMVHANVVSNGYKSKPKYSPPSSPTAGPVHGSSPPSDNKGFQWCNTTTQDGCHRCGRANHIAAYCIFNMPQNIKDWVMKGGYKQQANVVQLSDEDFQYESAYSGHHYEEPPDFNYLELEDNYSSNIYGPHLI